MRIALLLGVLLLSISAAGQESCAPLAHMDDGVVLERISSLKPSTHWRNGAKRAVWERISRSKKIRVVRVAFLDSDTLERREALAFMGERARRGTNVRLCRVGEDIVAVKY